MRLSGMVESLLNKLGAGTLKESAIKGQLALIYDQAKAQETDIEAQRAEIEYRDKRITELELKLRKQESAPEAERLKEDTEKVLALLFHQDLSTYQVAETLGMKMGVADYHLGVLCEKKMAAGITVSVVTDEGGYSGGDYMILQKGREYVMAYNLA